MSASTPISADILAQRWPTLSAAVSRYERNTAEQFTRMAYDRVDRGIITHDDRRHLADQAESLGIRPFDAQLLIACAVRQWALDRQFDPTPSRHAPALSPEYRAWSRLSVRIALIICTAVILDGIILWRWLS